VVKCWELVLVTALFRACACVRVGARAHAGIPSHTSCVAALLCLTWIEVRCFDVLVTALCSFGVCASVLMKFLLVLVL
jgi:hypothetical protein